MSWINVLFFVFGAFVGANLGLFVYALIRVNGVSDSMCTQDCNQGRDCTCRKN